MRELSATTHQRPGERRIEVALRRLTVDELRRSVGAVHRSPGLLAIIHGPLAGLRIELNRDVLWVGRDPENDIFLDDVSVSRHHAAVRRTGEVFVIVDLASVNGTYVNDARIAEAQLDDEDEVQVGCFKLVFFDGHRSEGTGQG